MPAAPADQRFAALWTSPYTAIAALALIGIAVSLIARYSPPGQLSPDLPLTVVLAAGGGPLVLHLAWRSLHGDFGSDQLAAVSIVASVLLHEYLAGVIVVLMLAGGNTLEQFAVAQAASVLRALARRLPTVAHLRRGGTLEDVPIAAIAVGDELSILPFEVCPVDGEVVAGHGAMDESYLTGEPFRISKGPGTAVLSGAINGESALTIRATRIAADSRYARIMRVMEEAEQRRPALRRIGDQLGAWYTPAALGIAGFAWWTSGEPQRFLSVVVVATPCPLIIAIPVAIIGAISSAARRGVIVRNPAALEQLALCRTMILDKTGTLTYGRPSLSGEHYGSGFSHETVLPIVAALERFSRHPLASALVQAAEAQGYALPQVEWVNEAPGRGLRGRAAGRSVIVTGRGAVATQPDVPPPAATGLECIVLIDDRYAASYQFHDQPRADSRSFISHLAPRHGFTRVMIVSGDRAPEVERLAQSVAISDVRASATPEEKVAIVRAEAGRAKTLFVGDGINDAPALTSATVGIAFGQNSDVTTEAADVVVIDSSLSKLDEVIHLSYRLRRVALESAIGGMALSAIGMGFAAAGALAPVAGAILQEGIDLVAVLNALRTASTPARRTDF